MLNRLLLLLLFSLVTADAVGDVLISKGGDDNSFYKSEKIIDLKRAGFVSALDFGADSSGIRDSTQALQKAADFAVANRLALFLNAGTYRHSTIFVRGSLSLIGAGRSLVHDRYIDRDGFSWVFESRESISIRDISFHGRGADATGGGAIQLNGAEDEGVNYYSLISNVSILDVWNGVHSASAAGFLVSSSYFSHCYNACLLVENVKNPDNGDSSVSNNIFANPPGMGCGILHLSSGGLRVVSNKFLGFDRAYYLKPMAHVATSDLIFGSNSLEGFSRSGISIASDDGGGYGNIVISGNQFAVIGNGVVGIDIAGQQNINVSSNVFRIGSFDEIGVRLIGVSVFAVGQNTFQGDNSVGAAISIEDNNSNGIIYPQVVQGIKNKVIRANGLKIVYEEGPGFLVIK